MIPDKIYLHEEDFARIYTQPSCIIDDDIEYIRKDALMEWAKEKLGKIEALSDNDAVHWGQANAFKQMIDKLNSL